LLRRIKLNDLDIVQYSAFQIEFYLGKLKKPHGRENMWVVVLVGFHVWPTNFAQAETNAILRCRGGYAISLATIFQVA
jgi:hypothetical protein